MWHQLLIGVVPLLVCAAALAATEKVPMKLSAFPLSQLRLLDGPCKVAQEANRRYLHELDFDRLLHAFRTNAGLPAPGKPLGGWEAPHVEVRGHFVGHYLSACALMYASTGDEKLKAKADALVAELAKCQKALGGEYLAAFPESFFDTLEAGRRIWVPYYTIHKIMAGLLDMYTLCGNEQALDVLKKMVPYFKRRIDRLPGPHMDRVLRVEFGGMSEVLHNLYAITGDPMHLEVAHVFDQAGFLGPLALEHDNLSGLHANTNIPKISGAARRYELTGDPRYRTIATYFWDRVVHTRSYATGGSNQREHWPEPNQLANTLAANNQECCTAHNMLKLTRYLIRWTGDPAYADYYERAFFNGILGTQHPETGMLMYFVPLATGHTKSFGTPYDAFWCCYGTGIESFAKLGDSIYFHDDDGITVNLSIASTVEWPQKGVRLEQHTSFPEEPTTKLTVRTKRPTAFTLRIRIPYWAGRSAQITAPFGRKGTKWYVQHPGGERMEIDGEVLFADQPSSYLPIQRKWEDGDTVEVKLPLSLHAQPMPDDPNLVAAMYGPLVLAGLTREAPHFAADPADPASWLAPVEGKPLTFQTTGLPKPITFIPLYKVLDEPYGVYWLVVQEGSERHKQLLAEEEARRKREARVVDRVLSHDRESEKAHSLQGENTQSGPHAGKGWRHAGHPGWWSWDLKVLPDVPMTLACTYWGSDVPPRSFDILVEGQKIATQALNRNKPGQFFDIEYPIPAELTRGKQKVTVRFVPHAGNTAGGVFECAVLKP